MAIPTPDPLPLPSPPPLLWALLMLTFLLHIIPMNLVLGGSLIAAVNRLRRGDDARKLATAIGKAMPAAVAATITFGVAPLLFVQALYGRLFFTSSVLMARFWFAVIPILILAYYGTYLIAYRGQKAGRILAPIVALLFLTIAFIYCNNMTFMLRPETFLGRYLADGRGTQLNTVDATFFPRLLHDVLGALAVAGFGVMIYGALQRRRDPRHGAWAVRHGAIWFAAATAVNVVTGLWWLLALPRSVLLRLNTTWLAAGVLVGAAAFVLTLLAIHSAAPARPLRWAGASLLLTLIIMIFARDDVRQVMLVHAGFRPTALIAPQWDVIALFAVLLVAALATTAWMVTVVVRGPAPAS